MGNRKGAGPGGASATAVLRRVYTYSAAVGGSYWRERPLVVISTILAIGRLLRQSSPHCYNRHFVVLQSPPDSSPCRTGNA